MSSSQGPQHGSNRGGGSNSPIHVGSRSPSPTLPSHGVVAQSSSPSPSPLYGRAARDPSAVQHVLGNGGFPGSPSTAKTPSSAQTQHDALSVQKLASSGVAKAHGLGKRASPSDNQCTKTLLSKKQALASNSLSRTQQQTVVASSSSLLVTGDVTIPGFDGRTWHEVVEKIRTATIICGVVISGTDKHSRRVSFAAPDRIHLLQGQYAAIQVIAELFQEDYNALNGTVASVEKALKERRAGLRKHWDLKTPDQLLFKVAQGSVEWDFVAAKFKEGGQREFKNKVVRVERVQNKAQFAQYEHFLERTYSEITGKPIGNGTAEELCRGANEVWGKHGTGLNSPDAVLNSRVGLNPWLSRNGALFGTGAYIAEGADYPNDKSFCYLLKNGKRAQMLLVRVAAGRIQENHEFRDFVRKEADKEFNSVRANVHPNIVSTGPQGRDMALVLYWQAQCYPAYLITYERP